MGKLIDRTGFTVGKLTVLYISPKRDSNGNCFWFCKCSCGKIKEISNKCLFSKKNPTTSCGCNRIKSLTGQIFGRLTVISIESVKTGAAFWFCRCSCGNSKVISSKNLMAKSTVSCGCYKQEKHFKNLVGQIFGRLIVIEQDISKENNRTKWECQCSCGNITSVLSNNLISKKVISCGCYNKEITQKNLAGKVFGRLTVLEASNKRASNGCVLWSCLCTCGNYKLLPTDRLLRKDLNSCGCLSIEKSTKRLQNNYRDYRISIGKDPDTLLTPNNKQIRDNIRTSGLLRAILLRDKYTCQICNVIGGALNVHHIIPFNKDKALVSEPTNLITLCHNCHILVAHDGNFYKINTCIQKYLQSLMRITADNFKM